MCLFLFPPREPINILQVKRHFDTRRIKGLHPSPGQGTKDTSSRGDCKGCSVVRLKLHKGKRFVSYKNCGGCGGFHSVSGRRQCVTVFFFFKGCLTGAVKISRWLQTPQQQMWVVGRLLPRTSHWDWMSFSHLVFWVTIKKKDTWNGSTEGEVRQGIKNKKQQNNFIYIYIDS